MWELWELYELCELEEPPLDPLPPLGPAWAVPTNARPITTAAALRRNRRIVHSFAAVQRFLFPVSGSLVPSTPPLKAAVVPRTAQAMDHGDISLLIN
jgi:hypothetical protein